MAFNLNTNIMNNTLKNEIIRLYHEEAFNDIDDLVPIINRVKNKSKDKKPYVKQDKQIINKVKLNIE